MRSFIIVTVCISAFLITGADQVFSQDSWNMELIGKAAYDGTFSGYVARGNYLLIASRKSNPYRGILTVVDVSDLSHPQRIGTFYDGPRISDLLVIDNLLYISLIYGGFAVFDIQNPSSPVELARIEENRGFGRLSKRSSEYIGSLYGDSFNFIDISDPLEPQIAGTIEMIYGLSGFDYFGDYLIIANGPSYYVYLEIYDISDITDITQVYSGPLYSAGYFVRLNIIENYAYLYHGLMGIHIYNISDPAVPESINTVFSNRYITDTKAHGNVLFATNYDGSLLSLDITDPKGPILITEFPTGSDASGLCLQGDTLYFGLAAGKISFLDVTDPGYPQPLGQYLIYAYIQNRVSKFNNYLYSGGEQEGLLIFDISDPTYPFLINYNYYPNQVHYTFIHNDLLFFTDHYDGTQIYRLDDPVNPSLRSTILNRLSAGQICASENYLYVPCETYGFEIFDITDPDNPFIAGDYWSGPGGSDCRVIVEEDGYAYVAEGEIGVGIYDVSDRTNPVKIGTYAESGGTIAIYYKDDVIYSANGTNGFVIIDVSDRYDPSLMSIVEGEWIFDVFVEDEIAYVADRSCCLKAYDVTDPYSPELIGTYEDYGRPSAVYVENDTVYVSAAEGGLWILRYDQTVGIENISAKPREFQLDQNHPNPFNAKTVLNYSLPESGVVTLSIYNILGQQVMTLFVGEKAAGEHTIAWDASTFPSGVYFARLETQDVSKTIKMVLLK